VAKNAFDAQINHIAKYMNKIIIVITTLALCSSIEAGFASFKTETSKAENIAIFCKAKITPASSNFGALFGAICGKEETAKYFVNEDPKDGSTLNIKVIWNDWHTDMGYGLHPDRFEAAKLLDLAIQLYASKLKDEIRAAFFENKNQTFDTDEFILTYTFHHGSRIDERILKIEEKAISSLKANPDDMKMAEKFIKDLPDACSDSYVTVREDGTVVIRLICANLSNAMSGLITIKDGIVREVK